MLDATVGAMAALRSRAESIEAYDQMIGEGNSSGNATVQAAIDALVARPGRSSGGRGPRARLDRSRGIDSLDNPNAVFQ